MDKKSTKRTPMLNIHRIGYFKYDIKELMARSNMEEDKIPSFIATLTAKASRMSIKDARDYIREVEERESFSKETADRLCALLDRYSKYR